MKYKTFKIIANILYLGMLSAVLVAFYVLYQIITANNADAIMVDRVIDGDTIVINNPNPPKTIVVSRNRIFGIDTPETSKSQAKCQKEIDLGLKAKEFTKEFVKEEIEVIYHGGFDDFGRYLISVKKKNQNLADELVKRGLAVYYDGKKKTKNWCE